MNNCTFVGRLGSDAQIKELDGGKKVLSFSLAVDDGKDRPPIWLDCNRWSEKNAIVEYLKKGTQIAVSGNVGLRTWVGDKGSGATITLRVLDIKLLSSKPANEQTTGNGTSEGQQSAAAIQEPIDDLPF